MSRPERQQAVLDILKGLRGLDPLKQLFWSELNYQRVNQPLSRHGWSDVATKALAEDPILFAGGGQSNDFHVVYSRLASDKLLFVLERPVVSRLVRDHPYAIFVFSNQSQTRWHFLNVKYDEQAKRRRLFRRITIGPEERLRTASERLTLLDLEAVAPGLFGLSPLAIQQQHDEAFDVEAVTKQFFDEYKAVFNNLQDDLTRQTKDKVWAHDYALQFINRVMFLYFVQRKRWLGEDTEFLRSFWETYRATGRHKDSFFDQWLKVLFFEAFNNKFHGGHRHFPDQIRAALSVAPYLNGGLFRQNELDDRYAFTVNDVRFEQLFRFLERYNFTISEDSPLDQEVAVDPEMIGKVYESLVNVEETSADQRSAAGIFYTPRTEIDLMCRLALVDHLTTHLGTERKDLLYEAVFALEADEKLAADRRLTEAKLWPELDSRIREVTVVDPACGSGSFLVGMLHVLNDLQERANRQLEKEESRYERQKRIIAQSLYGVDVMDWACHVAELRLWLALIVDSEITIEELHVRKEPLLPHFTFKIRCGDSLVQEVGGINLGHIRGSHEVPREIKARITRLKSEKLKFYNNDPICQFKSDDQVEREELHLFRNILDARSHSIQEEIKSMGRKIEGPPERQIRLDGIVEERPHQWELEAATLKTHLEALERDLERVSQARNALKTAKDVPFVWDIAFVEIFEGEKEGFDIVIGNPPYVRQENITDPRRPHDEVTTENKKAYKAKLAQSVYQTFPRYFGYKPSTGTVSNKLNAKSDLYIYFYFHGLALLNPKGSFCFITSNSWLDVGYGADLQEFLLKYCHVKLVLDNQLRRSFGQADVNTIIALFSPPEENREWGLDQTARFVMFKVPYEHVLSPVIFQEIDQADDRKTTQEYRISPVRQRRLLEEGCEVIQEEDDSLKDIKKEIAPLIKITRYIGNKWGGKYLRAPEIYWTILEKGKGKLVRLGDVADVRFGIKTGANEFFYLDEERIRKWGLEKDFLKPVLRRPKECERILLNPKEFQFKVFLCDKPKNDLKGTAALRYIEYGETCGYHRLPTCASRNPWYSLGTPRPTHIAAKMTTKYRHYFPVCRTAILVDNRFYEVRALRASTPSLAASLNAPIVPLWLEATGRTYGGGGGPLDIKVYELKQAWLIDPSLVDSEASFWSEEILKRPVLHIWKEAELSDRRAFDEPFFELLGLTTGEREAVYESLVNMVRSRLEKARSLGPKERLKRVEAAEKTRGIWANLPVEVEEAEEE